MNEGFNSAIRLRSQNRTILAAFTSQKERATSVTQGGGKKVELKSGGLGLNREFTNTRVRSGIRSGRNTRVGRDLVNSGFVR